MDQMVVQKRVRRSELGFLIGPILGLLIFLAICALIFPKPSRIYREGVLKDCKCRGLTATPKGTKAVGVGEAYCLGIPYECKETQILKGQSDE